MAKKPAKPKVYIKRLTGWRYWWARLRGQPVEVPASIDEVKVSAIYGIPDGEDPIEYIRHMNKRDT